MLLCAAAPLAAKENPLPFRNIVVNHFVNSSGASLSSDFIQYFCDGLRDALIKNKAAG